jgi:poly(3-hydroxybutyrate) depolymerase
MRTVDAIERVACVDRSRVYAVGISNGGFMSTVLAWRAAAPARASTPRGRRGGFPSAHRPPAS